MITESAIGGGALGVFMLMYKALNKQVSNKVDKEVCKGVKDNLCGRMDKGDLKFNKIMGKLEIQGEDLSEIKGEMKQMNINFLRERG